MAEHFIYRALASRVLAVAMVNDQVGDWAAYINAVPGINHEREKEQAARTGEKLPIEIARYLFPDIATQFRWRD